MKEFLAKITLTVIFLAVLSACASTSSKPSAEAFPVTPIPAEIPEWAANRNNAVSLTSLGNSNLPAGKCGMVLWTLDANRPVPILRYVVGENGEFHLNRVPYELVRLEVVGNGNFGIFPQQRFAAGTDIRVTVDVQFGQGFDGGSYLEKGVIRLEQPDSPTLITPVAGIAGCRAK